MPPPKYDKPYEGEIEIIFFSSSEDVKQACKMSDGISSETGCARWPDDKKRCRIALVTEDLAKREGKSFAFMLRHELAHCNGWKHPTTTGGRKFNVGDKWDEAEGEKWLRIDTKMSMPKLPASTRIPPASPPVICVTPDWKQEPCNERNERPAWFRPEVVVNPTRLPWGN